MWPGGRICSNCALARKCSAQSAWTAWISTGGGWKNWNVVVPCWRLGETCKRRTGGDKSRTGWFRLFLYRKDVTFAEFDEQDQTRAGEEAPVSLLAESSQVYYLEGTYMSAAF